MRTCQLLGSVLPSQCSRLAVWKVARAHVALREHIVRHHDELPHSSAARTRSHRAICTSPESRGGAVSASLCSTSRPCAHGIACASFVVPVGNSIRIAFLISLFCFASQRTSTLLMCCIFRTHFLIYSQSDPVLALLASLFIQPHRLHVKTCSDWRKRERHHSPVQLVAIRFAGPRQFWSNRFAFGHN